MRGRVRVGSLLFEGGSGWAEFDIERDGLTGWFDGVPADGERVRRPTSDGTYPSRAFRPGRTIVLNGHVWSHSFAEQEHSFDRLKSISETEPTRFVVDTDRGSRWADVVLEEGPEFTNVIAGRFADYRLQFYARDPLKYGETRSFAAGEGAYHYGNAPSFPVIEVRGVYASGYTVSAGGKSFVVSAALASGQVHSIDMRTGALSLNGSRVLGGVSSASTWAVQPGTVLTHTLTGPGTLTVKVSDAWR